MQAKNKFYLISITVVILFVLAMLKLAMPPIKTLYYGYTNPFLNYKEEYVRPCYPNQRTLLEAYKLYISDNGTKEAQNMKSFDLYNKKYMPRDPICPGKFQRGILDNYIIKTTEPYNLSYNLINDTINVEVFCPLHKTTISDQMNINEIKPKTIKSFFKY